MRSLTVILVVSLMSFIIGCSKTENVPLTKPQIKELLFNVQQMPLEPVEKNELAVLETNYGKMVLSFFPDIAPEHCKAFKRLVKAGYYDGIKFHRIVKDFMIQGGDILSRDADPNNDGYGSPGYTLPAEFSDIPHDKGILSMARRGGDDNSAGSQFFICLSRKGCMALDGKYTVFGKVVDGIDVLEKIGDLETTKRPNSTEKSMPVEPVVIKKAYMKIQ